MNALVGNVAGFGKLSAIMPTEPAYTVGLDLGQRNDYTAISVIETQCWSSSETLSRYPWPGLVAGWNAPSALHPEAVRYLFGTISGRWPAKPALAVRHLERVRGKPYPEIVDRVEKLMQSEPLVTRGVTLAIDSTGCGIPVLDLFRARGLRPAAITITGGDRVNHTRNEWRVPKRDLVAAVQSALQTDRLKIADQLEHAETLRTELQRFKVKIALSGHDSYGAGGSGEAWREAPHDDLVLAVSMAVFWRDHYWRNFDRARLSAPVARNENAA